MEYNTHGKHILLDVWVNGDLPNFDDLVKKLTAACKLHIADELIKDFEPYGQTRLYLLTESHLTIHTYPEHWYFSMDIYTCGEEWEPENAPEVLRDSIPNIKNLKFNNVTRGHYE